jgi:GT2 family glycosyltransferase
MMQLKNKHLQINWTETKHSNMFPGGASIINRRLFDRVGLYDEDMKIGLEDWEFALRALLSGTPAAALAINDILLIHEHRLAEDDMTLKAILTRYDKGIIENSYRHFLEKHEIIWAHDFTPWLEDQIQLMTNPNRNPTSENEQ